jgi:hypothetical protein
MYLFMHAYVYVCMYASGEPRFIRLLRYDLQDLLSSYVINNSATGIMLYYWVTYGPQFILGDHLERK